MAMRPGKRKALKKNSPGRAIEKLEKTKASVRAKVEHCFHVVKGLFKHRKTRNRGLAKNNAQLFTRSDLPIWWWPAGTWGACTPELRLQYQERRGIAAKLPA